MSDTQIIPEAVLEVIGPDGSHRVVRLTHSPFLIGRGGDTGNHLQLPDRRISRECAAVVYEGGEFRLKDRGQRRGLFINGEKVDLHALHEGDTINFGLPDSYEVVFHTGQGTESLPQLLSRMEHMSTVEPGSGIGTGLRMLSKLLEATALLHSRLPLDDVLCRMLDQTIGVTDADRGLLLEPTSSGPMRVRLARQRGDRSLPAEGVEPSQNAVRMALEQKRSVVIEDVAQADADLQAAQSIIVQRLRAVVVIPLYAMAQAGANGATEVPLGELLGVIYLDSRSPAAFSSLERQMLDALAVEAGSVIDNARLLQRERERQRMEQELSIARDIQQALLPREFGHWPHLQVTGINQSCLTVGGDYFDMMELGPGRVAIIIADVSGKGLGAALLTTMLQGALSGMTIGQEPAQVFAHVNRFLCDHSQLERYATMFFATLDTTGRFEYINAGHPSPLLVRGGDVQAPFPAECFPVGLLPDAVFKSCACELKRGDTLVLFSDGVNEARNPQEEEFGVPRLKEVLAANASASVKQMQSAVLSAVADFTRGAAQADDITLLLIHYEGAIEGRRDTLAA